MGKALSFHFGVNEVAYGGYKPIVGAELDARAMEAIARLQGFDHYLFPAKDATARRCRKVLEDAVTELKGGGALILTFAGHGDRFDDQDGDDPTPFDQALCFYERAMPDDELYRLLAAFDEGVMILVTADSCYSGSVVQNIVLSEKPARSLNARTGRSKKRANGPCGGVTWTKRPKGWPEMKATVVQLAASADYAIANEVDGRGVFTRALTDVWNQGTFDGTLCEFYEKIYAKMPLQQPRMFLEGTPNDAFLDSPPFSIQPVPQLPLRKARRR